MSRERERRRVRERPRGPGLRPRAVAGPLLLALAGAGLGGGPVASADEKPRAERATQLTADVRHSVNRGFSYLLRRQKATRSFQNDPYPVAVNALFGLALLASGTTETTGPKPEYVEALKRCTTTVLAYQEPSGYFHDTGSRMYGHGFATLFLAELYGMSPGRNEQVRDALRRAVELIERSQRKEGGWDYEPLLGTGGHQEASDTSITVCQTMALRAARNLGILVDEKVVSLARKYIRSAQNEDGGFRYRSGGLYGMQSSEFPRSAAGVCILYSLGEYSSPEIKRGLRYLEDHYRESNNFPFYAQYYCSQAMFQVGGREWRAYYDWARERLLADQRKDGSWQARALQFEKNPDQTTSMALIVLQLPYRFLPIHER